MTAARLRDPALTAVLLILPLLLHASPAAQAASSEEVVDAALAFLAARQDELNAAYAVEAVAAAGLNPKTWPTPERNIFSALRPDGGSRDKAYKAGLRIANAAGSAGYDPRSVNGHDFVADAWAGYDGLQFGDPTMINDDIWAILALRAAGVPASDERIQRAATVVETGRAADGGWNYMPAAGKGATDLTGYALAALKAAGRDVSRDARAQQFLDRTYDPETGGHGYESNAAADLNCNSAVWAIHGYAAMGIPPRPKTLQYLHSLWNPADGGISWKKGWDSNTMCTTEAVVVLAGARYPLPSRAPPPVPTPAHAAEPYEPAAVAPFTTVTYTFGPEVPQLEGAAVFPSTGAYPYRVLAEGPGVRARGEGTLQVLSARPRLPVLPEQVEALRHEPVRLDLSGAHDPDGTLVRVLVDWGNGHTAELAGGGAAEHAYALPGPRHVTVRAQDDAGFWSDTARLVVEVRNRAPLFESLPARLVANRTAPLAFTPLAKDPDGDDVRISWAIGDGALREMPMSWQPSALGNVTLRLVAADQHDGTTGANVTVEVVNLPPVLANVTIPSTGTTGVAFGYSAHAEDPDGPAPLVTWRFGNVTREGLSGEVALDAGEHEVEAAALDADGARRIATGRIRIDDAPAPTPAEPVVIEPDREEANASVADEAPSALAPPTFLDLATVRAGEPTTLAVAPVEEAESYRFEFGDGKATPWAPATAVEHAWARPGTYEVRAWARAADGRVSSGVATLTVEAPPAPTPAAAADPMPPEESPLEQASLPVASPEPPEATPLRPQEAPRASPAPGPLLALAAAAALAGRRAKRAA